MSGLLVQVRGSLPAHFHKRTQETVLLIRGEGIFQLGTERIPIQTGSVMRISPGQVHTFTNTGPAPAVFLVVTTPRWDERDRFMVREGALTKDTHALVQIKRAGKAGRESLSFPS